jgi:isorenieratene synthase
VNTHQEKTFAVVVIGGGLAGLTAAAHLAQRGIAPIVLEASSLWPGGRLSGGDPDSFDYQGRQWSFAPDHGVHAVWGGYHNMRAMLTDQLKIELRESNGEEWINRWRREIRVIEAGKSVQNSWIPAPFHYLQLLFRLGFWRTITPFDFLSLPGFLFSVLWTVGLDPIREKIALDGLEMKEYFRGWTPNLRATFHGLGVNLLAAPAESISLTAFIAAIRFYTMLRRDAWRLQFFTGNSHDHLIAPLIKRIEAHGGKVLYGATALKLERETHAWRVIVEDAPKRGLRSLRAQEVILGVNPAAAQRLLDHSPDTPTDGLKFPASVRSIAIRLWFSRQPRPGASSGMMTGDFQIDNFFWLHQLYDEFHEWREQGGSAVEVHIYGPEKLVDQPDQNLLITALNELQLAFPELRGHFVYGVVRRNSRTHSVFRVPTADSLHLVTPWTGITACGDWIGYDTPAFWMERAVTTGIAAANRVLVEAGQAPFPLIEPSPPEPLAHGLSKIVGVIRRGFRPIIGGLRYLRRKKDKRVGV